VVHETLGGGSHTWDRRLQAFVIETARPPTFERRLAAEPLRRLVAAVDPSAPLGSVAPLRAIARESLREQRFLVLLLGLFAATAALLSAVGLYGVLAHTLARRTREIGVRMALGARSADVLRWLAAKTATLVAAGLALGLAAALMLTRLLEARLYEVDPRDAWTYAAATGALVLVCALAALRPARRALAVDPVSSLRQD